MIANAVPDPRLTWRPERGAFVLREAFDYPYPRVAEVLGLSEANARQLVTAQDRAHRADAIQPK